MRYLKMVSFNKMLLLTIVIGALVLITACSFLGKNKRSDNPPSLINVDFGANYKIQKISGHPDKSLFYIKTNKTYILATRLRTYDTYHWKNYWRISNNGELLDTFASGNYYNFSSAGVSFGENSYNDWPLTGDKRDKEYLKIVHSNEIDRTTLQKLLSNSEQILWNDFYCYTSEKSTKSFCYYLKSGNNWTLLISKEKLLNNPPTECPPVSHISFSRKTREDSLDSVNKGLLDKAKTDELYPLTFLPWLDVEFSTEKRIFNALKLDKFDAEYSVRPGFLSQTGWTGKVGTGSMQLNFDNQTFNFKTYMREIPYSGVKKYEPDISLAHAITTDDQPSFLLMQLSTRGLGDNRDDSEAGIYIIRKDNLQGTPPQQPITQLKLNGFQTTPIIRWIIDNSGFRSDWPDKKPEINMDYLAPLKSFPVYIDLHFYFAKELVSNKSKIYLKINNATWHWEHADSVYATLYIDPDELTSAIKELDDDNLTLSITAKTQENTTRLALTLESAKSSIPLNKVIVVSKASDN